ncbi:MULTISPECIES: response regulator transcription factor [Bacillaceae]|uniref:DNA-binding response OmpR family regulator n=1 Tax=Peribacillus huizhouensis TaxID=1501239 RepID=A0ABR6CQ24_9BACI|nr:MULTISPECIES: response regulator transcription factor [Bacillaceae]MBA9027142.1 DNA-binding response OmpR family regulator [Peribacillus huizhouensis]
MDEILIVEDDADIQKILSMNLSLEGFAYTIASTGMDAIKKVREKTPDLILLDIQLPDMNGIDLCQQLREMTAVPILYVTCNNEDKEKILAFACGGDDYIEKPFNSRVLIARIKAHLRRNSINHNQSTLKKQITFDDIVIDLTAREVKRNGQVIELTAKEFELLTFFAKHPNQVFSAEQLLNQIWGYDSFSEKSTIIVHISNLRKKIEDYPVNPSYIITMRGVGYKFVQTSI